MTDASRTALPGDICCCCFGQLLRTLSAHPFRAHFPRSLRGPLVAAPTLSTTA